MSSYEEIVNFVHRSKAELDKLPASAFCGPNRTFPVVGPADVGPAADLAGHADNPSAVRACIKRKAKANGWHLPASWAANMSNDDLISPEWFTEEGWEEVETHLFTETDATFAGSPNNRGNLTSLLKYWHTQMGGGSGRPGDFNECVATLAKHADKISDPKALCAWLHKKSTGARPGQASAEHSFTPALDVDEALQPVMGEAYAIH